MNKIKVAITILMLVSVKTSLFAQWYNIVNPSLVVQKTAVTTAIGAEAGLVGAQTALVSVLAGLEKDYADRRKMHVNLRTTPVFAVTVLSIETCERKISQLTTRANRIRFGRFFFKSRMKNIEFRLEKEDAYIQAIRSDYDEFAYGVINGGGDGLAYAASMKLLMRTNRVRKNVLLIEKEIKDFELNNRIFVKR